MWEKRDSLAMDLSYGQRKLMEIGRAMAMEVHTYLFDEPFAGLFPQMLERVKAIMKDLREEGNSLIFISHNMDIVRELADRIIVLDGGRLLMQGGGERGVEPGRGHQGLPGRVGERRTEEWRQVDGNGNREFSGRCKRGTDGFHDSRACGRVRAFQGGGCVGPGHGGGTEGGAGGCDGA